MAVTEKHETRQMHHSDRRAFYLCNELDCGFFYDSMTKRVTWVSEIEVFVVVLGKKVKLKPVGRGDRGYQDLVNQGMENSIFPANLFSRPFQIDVKVSRTVTPELHERWLKLIAYYKNEPFVSDRTRNTSGCCMKMGRLSSTSSAPKRNSKRCWSVMPSGGRRGPASCSQATGGSLPTKRRRYHEPCR
jgi:hypothetical protein